MNEDPNWPRASAWLAGEHDPDPTARLAVLGAPLWMGSLSGGRYDLAPGAVREALHRYSTYEIETGVDIRTVAAHDEGDLPLGESRPEDALVPLAGAVGGSLDAIDAVVVLGGDNSVTRPAVRGLSPVLEGVGLVTLDAHFDLRHTEDGLNNGNPIRALLEDGLPGENVVQIGIQGFANSAAYAAVATSAGITVVTAETVHAQGIEPVVAGALEHIAERADRLYVDVDLDVLDRAHAPACPGARPGGLRPAQLRQAARLAGRHRKVRALDVVEVDPLQDVADVTVLAAASCLLAFAAGLAAR